MIEPTASWYTLVPALPVHPTPTAFTPQQFTTIHARAQSLHSAESSKNSQGLTASSSEAAFLQRVLTSGTLSDRLSALTLMAQSSPIHNSNALESLRAMAQKKGREESLKALRAIVDWWVGGGAPPRKLRTFRDQPLSHPQVTDKHLLLWFFEDWLKKYFFSILQILEALSLDPLPYVRTQAMSLIFTLLRDNPEQEQNLLRLLVNKLGDSEKHVASRASYHLLQLLQTHPQMKAVVVREVTALVLRPVRPSAAPAVVTTHGQATHIKFAAAADSAKTKPKPEERDKKDVQHGHARYYAAITFNQIMLSPTPADREVAVQLVNVYFELFKEILGDGLAGEDAVDRVDDDEGEKDGKKKKGKAKMGPMKRGKGKGKEIRGEAGFAEVEDADSKITSAILTGVNRALPFAKLDVGNVSFSKHIDTLFLITHTSNFNISLQALRLLLQICVSLSPASTPSTPASSKPNPIVARFYRTLYASLQDPRLALSSKQAMYLNLLFKAVKIDQNADRVKAFVRRFMQLLVSGGSGGAEFVAGGLYLLGELFSTEAGLRDMFGHGSEATEEYDPKKRDPKFAHASASPFWELTPLVHHYHPTVRLHASQLLAGQALTANADLALNTLSHFLDRFVYKNPKKPKPRGTSAMQPAGAAADGTGVRLVKGAQVGGEGVVNEQAFWGRRVQDVPVDQVFFHKYFSQKHERVKAKGEKVAKRKGAAEGTEEGSVDGAPEGEGVVPSSEDEEQDESEGEAEIWQAMKASIPDRMDDDLLEEASDDDDGSNEDGASVLDGSNDDEGMSMAEGSDEEDLVDLDSEVPMGLIDYASDGSAEEWGGIGDATTTTKRKRGDGGGGGGRKKLRALPTFATYEDYAKMIEEGPEDDV